MAGTETAVYVYTGEGDVPKDVIRVKFASTVTEIGWGTFRDCAKLRHVVLNEGLKIIGKKAFYGCILLESAKLPSTVTEVCFEAFSLCPGLREVILNEGLLILRERAFMYCVSLKSIKLPSTVTKIGEMVFYSCSEMKVVVLNEGLQSIGEGAFRGCTSLESIKLPSTIMKVDDYTFCNCFKLREVVLNEGLQIIQKWAFLNCRSLKSIHFPSTVTEVGEKAFNHCTKLRDIVLREGLKIIGVEAFEECSSLKIILLPSTVLEIGQDSFLDCTKLREVVLHKGIQLEMIEEHVFVHCSALKRFKFARIYLRLDSIGFAAKTEIEDMITNEIPGASNSDGDLLITFEPMEGGPIWGVYREILSEICGLITYHELKEATTIIELVLWKAKIEEESGSIGSPETCLVEVSGPTKRAKIEKKSSKDREACRVLCGASIIMEGVLQFCSFNEGW